MATDSWLERLPKAAGTVFQNKKRVLLGETVIEKADPVWYGDQDEDAEDLCYLPRPPPLHLEVQSFQNCCKNTPMHLSPVLLLQGHPEW
uniref:Uncharacterized protein n=1 Tax=Sus scrofa TaxID=9823 RepID=A0A8D0M4D5_PIG